MRRREFITALGVTATWPFATRAQRPAFPVVGFLRSTPLADETPVVTAFRQGLKEEGFVEGQNIAVEYHSAEDQADRLSALFAELVRRPMAAIVGDGRMALTAKAAKTTMPIVFAMGADPVKAGLVTSFNRPGGNITGVVFTTNELGPKRLELLRQLAPKATIIGQLIHPYNPEADEEEKNVQAGARAIGLQLITLDVGSDADIDAAFATFVERGASALIVDGSPFLYSHRKQLVALAARYALPAVYNLREFVVAGGLSSYGTSITESYRQVGIHTGRILKGTSPADLPVVQTIKFEQVINLKTAKALGLTVPLAVLTSADEVID